MSAVKDVTLTVRGTTGGPYQIIVLSEAAASFSGKDVLGTGRPLQMVLLKAIATFIRSTLLGLKETSTAATTKNTFTRNTALPCVPTT